jgi:alpha-L-rhamnosidase
MLGKNIQIIFYICIVIISQAGARVMTQSAPPSKLTVSEGFENPIGFYDATPTFSWQLPQDGSVQRQSAYRITVASAPELLPGHADLWDSGKINSEQSVWVPYQGKPLQSKQRVYLQIRYWDEQNRASAWSEPAHFELGLLENSDWQGRWIRMNKAKPVVDSENKATFIPEYLRKEFAVAAPIVSARLYVTAKGLYEIYLNGQRVGRDFMVPGWTPFQTRLETMTYDVTEQLCQGRNAVGAILGEGWYAGVLMHKNQPIYPEVQPLLLLQLEITRADGQTQTIVSDQTWKASDQGPIRFSGIYNGEIYDARKEIPGWNKVGYDDSAWASVTTEAVTDDIPLVPKRHNPVRVTEKLPTLAITEPVPGKFIFDLGQNMVGWSQLTIPVETGKTITVRVAEMLQEDGTLYMENYRSAKSTDYYTGAKNGTITWHPTFTFHGYRYIELSGFPTGIKPKKSWVTGVVLHSDFKQSGQFTSSHTKLNQLQQNITWGMRGNYLDIPTDCPQRDERLGWTGDAQVFCSTSLFNYDVHSFWTSWLQSVREEQVADGLIPHVVPNILKGMGSPGWGDVAVISPWHVYVRTGNREVLVDNYDMMQRWTAAYEKEAKDYIVHRLGYLDWLQPYPQSEDERRADTPKEVIATAYFGRCTAVMQKVATLLDKPEEAKHYEELFVNIRRAFSKAFFDANGKLTTPIPTQTAYLMALGYDLLEPHQRDGAVENLLALIETADGHLRTGFLGTPLIAFVLDDCGHTDIAYQVLFKETYPSWFYSINQGATTLWERWNSYSHKNGFGDAAMNSFNHYAYGAIGQWMYERIAGLAPDPQQPGYKHFFIQPRLGGPLSSAKAELETPYGKAASGWKTENGRLRIEATVPPNTSAKLVVPPMKAGTATLWESGQVCSLVEKNGRLTYKVKPGKHVFTIESTQAATVQTQTTHLNGVEVPGIVLAHSPKSTRRFIDSPSIIILSNGDYLASYQQGGDTHVHCSSDRGRTWTHLTAVEHTTWSSLFEHSSTIYLMGVTGSYGNIYISRSNNGGKTWTEPTDAQHGLLTDKRGYHTGPVPVVVHKGRIWRAFENTIPSTGWGHRFQAFVMSAPVDADLIDRNSWTFSNELARDPSWLECEFHGWLEGNIVVMPDDKLVNMLRVDRPPHGDTAAMIRINEEKHTISFDPKTGFIDFPGAGKKFVIRFDPKSQQYLSLTNWVPPAYRTPDTKIRAFLASQPRESLAPNKRGKLLTDNGFYNFERTRNTLALITSPDLIHWQVRYIVLQGNDVAHHGFQYVDWQFDGNDLIALSRTAYDDGVGVARTISTTATSSPFTGSRTTLTTTIGCYYTRI